MHRLVVGRVRRPHGLEGTLLVTPETDDPEGVYRPGRVFGVSDLSEDLPRRLTLETAGPGPKGWRLRFLEIHDRDTAERYAGGVLELAQEELAELGENEFFLHDLVGLVVQDAEGHLVGRVDWVVDRPGQPVLVVVDERDDRSVERLIPFSSAIVRSVDMDAGVVHVDPPPGLLEL